jgi:hypothetical protein
MLIYGVTFNTFTCTVCRDKSFQADAPMPAGWKFRADGRGLYVICPDCRKKQLIGDPNIFEHFDDDAAT